MSMPLLQACSLYHASKQTPATQLCRSAACRVLQVVHLVPPQLSGSAGYRRWAATLPGQQVHPPAASPTGFVAATRMLAKLSLVSRRVFPLPCTAGVRASEAAQQPAEAAAERQQVTATAASGMAEMQPPAGGDVPAASNAPASDIDMGPQVFTIMLVSWAPHLEP